MGGVPSGRVRPDRVRVRVGPPANAGHIPSLICMTTTPLPAIADQYLTDGFVLVKGVLSRDEAASVSAELHSVLDRLQRGGGASWPSAMKVAMGPTTLRALHDVHTHSELFAGLLVDPRITGPMAAVLGTPNVQLHHNKAFVKPPGNGAPFPLHQDHPFFPHRDHRVGAAILHLDDATTEKGCLRLVPGSQLLGPLEHVDDGGYNLPDQDIPGVVSVPAEAGDLLLFSYLTIHGSGVNLSTEDRTTWLIQYRDPTDRPLTDAHTWSAGQGMMLAGEDPTA